MPIRMTEAAFEKASESNRGRCIKCGHTQSHCEPDAREYECGKCHEKTVYGYEELMMMGEIELK